MNQSLVTVSVDIDSLIERIRTVVREEIQAARETPDPDELLTVKEAASILKITVWAVYQRIKTGSLQNALGNTRQVRIRRGDLVRAPRSHPVGHI